MGFRVLRPGFDSLCARFLFYYILIHKNKIFNINSFVYQFLFYFMASLTTVLLEVNNCVIFIPKIKAPPQNRGILRLFKGISSRKGPGHNPPIPQPSPNKNDPIISFQSIECCGSDKSLSKSGFFLNKDIIYMPFLIKENTKRLIKTPDISTTNKLGSQSLLSSKNPYIFYLLDIPASIKPNPKIVPIKKYTTVLIIFPNDLCCDKAKHIRGITAVPIR